MTHSPLGLILVARATDTLGIGEHIIRGAEPAVGAGAPRCMVVDSLDDPVSCSVEQQLTIAEMMPPLGFDVFATREPFAQKGDKHLCLDNVVVQRAVVE